MARSTMLAGFTVPEPNKCICGSCRGKGFSLSRGGGDRHSRKCQRCRGKGYTTVGSTKR